MDFKINDYVTRISHNNDMVFKIIDIKDNVCYLKGLDVRLIADSNIADLVLVSKIDIDDREFIDKIMNTTSKLDRDDYFYLPGKILHIDGDVDYLERCLNYYKKANIMSLGIKLKESEIADNILSYLEEFNPNILVITGHDAYYKKKGNDLSCYKNSANFVNAVKQARKYEKNHDKLIIIAGACQSDYEELIKAGANFASSPKRINIHALDPAIIASLMSLSDINNDIDLKTILNSTKYGADAIGGIITKGTMYKGYPR